MNNDLQATLMRQFSAVEFDPHWVAHFFAAWYRYKVSWATVNNGADKKADHVEKKKKESESVCVWGDGVASVWGEGVVRARACVRVCVKERKRETMKKMIKR